MAYCYKEESEGNRCIARLAVCDMIRLVWLQAEQRVMFSHVAAKGGKCECVCAHVSVCRRARMTVCLPLSDVCRC